MWMEKRFLFWLRLDILIGHIQDAFWIAFILLQNFVAFYYNSIQSALIRIGLKLKCILISLHSFNRPFFDIALILSLAPAYSVADLG